MCLAFFLLALLAELPVVAKAKQPRAQSLHEAAAATNHQAGACFGPTDAAVLVGGAVVPATAGSVSVFALSRFSSATADFAVAVLFPATAGFPLDWRCPWRLGVVQKTYGCFLQDDEAAWAALQIKVHVVGQGAVQPVATPVAAEEAPIARHRASGECLRRVLPMAHQRPNHHLACWARAANTFPRPRLQR